MLDTLPTRPQDPLLGLLRLYAADPRPGKIDLGVGVYRDESGRTPVLDAVKAAEHRIWERQDSKSYQGMEGDRAFLAAFGAFLFGGRPLAAVQTIGGSGALRLAADLLLEAGSRRIWVGTPTWPNHQAIIKAGRLEVVTYPAIDRARGAVDFPALREALARLEPGDVALLHGCCHNPTGAGLTLPQWAEIAAILKARGAVPLVDLAYMGFGQGLREDLAGTQLLLEELPEVLVAISCSKNFALYRDRIGALFVQAKGEAARAAAQSTMESLARVSYSMPAAHGAAVVATILEDDTLRAGWLVELEGMRRRIVALREALAAQLAPLWPGATAIAAQEGMFTMLPVTPEQVTRLREAHGVYMAESGRINMAGLRERDVPRLVEALRQVGLGAA
ncbi:aromatic amino acid transaminase [Roseomonas sp. GC11]|uniref:aromatic amino acid transaminase n=1 Tax=Roseomonas sp. GC11 TaxID=2950546 RepID=UPI002108EF43|nr:aromatic amino acid transaminase [Roseomonas sp. GC11]MCQ4162047.1 aromatic amino acid transaminase [Roseomonas sp. GC11]